MDVLRDDTMKVPAFEHQIYMCSACRHRARRLVFSRTKCLSLICRLWQRHPTDLWKGYVALPSTPGGKQFERLSSRQTDLKERAAAAKTAT